MNRRRSNEIISLEIDGRRESSINGVKDGITFDFLKDFLEEVKGDFIRFIYNRILREYMVA
jgi:hypothetical protein